MDQYFIIAIGGTGMRCLESFVHLCAIGMFDNKEINILTLDTDQNNGNKERVEGLINQYNKIKTENGRANAKTFFSAKLNLYRFFTSYSEQEGNKFRTLAGLSEGDPKDQKENQDLANLFLDQDTVQDFSLVEGYRAQTHLGSYLMYCGILSSARRSKTNNKKLQDSDLRTFVENLGGVSDHARVFVFGSVFGGTGASSIPVIPRALNEAYNIYQQKQFSQNIKYGSTLLTQYFKFESPTGTEQLRNEKVIADSSNFSINSQAAMYFYERDNEVKKSYKCMYHIGWPFNETMFGKEEGKIVTGGLNQKNKCHVVELLCASAAYDFFNRTDLEDIKETLFLYKTVDIENGNPSFEGKTFIKEDGDLFTLKLGAFLSFAHIILTAFKAANGNDSGLKNLCTKDYLRNEDLESYKNITDDEFSDIDDYFRQYFGYNIDNEKQFHGEWIYQIKDSIPGNFIFSKDALIKDIKELDTNRNDIPGIVFKDDRYNWKKSGGWLSGFLRQSNHMNTFLDIFKDPTKCNVNVDEKGIETPKEQFIARIYNAIQIAQSHK